MSELEPSLIPLDKGLNLQTAKLVAPVGSVLDTLNYEQVDFQGQKRIDGFVRYDGSLLSAIDEYYAVVLSDTAPAIGSIVYNGTNLLGKVVGSDDTTMYLAAIDANFIPVVGDELFVLNEDTLETAGTVSAVATGTAEAEDADEHYNNLLQFNAVLRSDVEELPGPVIGLHWFRDRLYAVADVAVVSLEGTTPVIHPNDVLDIAGDEDVKVLDSFVRDNTRLVFLSTLNPALWQVEGTNVLRNAVSVGSIANGFESIESEEEIASFFESRTEAQVIEEDETNKDYGWKFIDQGWSVNFENGVSLFGSLPSLNQNITGLGVQGPTNTSGNNGLPLILTQKVSTTNTPAQVNGWKSSQTPTTYELETDNLIEVDDDFIYADAYISWNGTTGEVVGVTAPLVEYAATNTVEIELP